MKIILALLAVLIVLAGPVLSQTTTTPSPASAVKVVNCVQFTGNVHVPDKDLINVIGIRPGDLVTASRIQFAIQAIENEYKNRGYVACIANLEDMVATFLSTGVLKFDIAEARVAQVRIEGLIKTKECVIREVLRLRPGDLYSEAAVSQDALRLQALAIFASVDASLEPCETPGKLILVWKLVEKDKTGYISLSGSYGPAGGLIGTVTAVQGNLRGRAEQLRVIASISSVDARVSGEVNYIDPVLTCDTAGTLDAFDAVYYKFSQSLLINPNEDIYFERRVGGRVGWIKSFSSVHRLTATSRYEHVEVDNLPVQDLTPGVTNASGDIGSIGLEWVDDTRNSPIYPTRGIFSRVAIEPSYVNQQDSTNAIFRGEVEARAFKAFGSTITDCTTNIPPPVIAFRVRTGAYAGTLPFFEQFFLGGVHGLRGYTEDRFWGPYLIDTTAEYRQPVTKSVAIVLFVDAGDAWGSRWQFVPGTNTDFIQHESFSPRAGFGIGGRYVGPLGALGLDFAYGEHFFTTLVFGQTF